MVQYSKEGIVKLTIVQHRVPLQTHDFNQIESNFNKW